MLPSDMHLNIRLGTAGYNNKILVSDGKFSLGKNEKVNSLEPAKVVALEPTKAPIKSHKVVAQLDATQDSKPTITHEEEKAAPILFIAGAFTIWYMFHQHFIMILGTADPLSHKILSSAVLKIVMTSL